MIERPVTIDGQQWTASLSGRVTMYDGDEFSLVFARRDEHGRLHRRVSRFSPTGSRNRAVALQELSEVELASLFRQSQPEDTSPELNYAR